MSIRKVNVGQYKTIVEITTPSGNSWRECYSDMSGWASLDIKRYKELGYKVGLVKLCRNPMTDKLEDRVVYGWIGSLS